MPLRSTCVTRAHHSTTTPTKPADPAAKHSRRSVLCDTFSMAAAVQLAAAAAAQARQGPPTNKEVDAAESPYIQELLRRSQEQKAQRDKERLQAYYKKNFKEYFEFEAGNARAGAARGISTETQAAINRWLETNQ